MKPVAIFRHNAAEGPGYFATFLDRRSIPWRLIAVDRADPVPNTLTDWSGLCFMGGPMSVNDNLPWVLSELALIRDAVRADLPVIGHCLGGQLVAKAMGGEVKRNPVKEIGWGAVRIAEGDEARRWFGDLTEFSAFHWHGETFTLPPGAAPLLSSAYCRNQAFSHGKHLGLQCHVEMTAAMIRRWGRAGMEEIGAHSGPSVQSPDQMCADLENRVAALNGVADRIYARWIEGLRD